RAALAGGALPQPPLGPALDRCPMAGGHVAVVSPAPHLKGPPLITTVDVARTAPRQMGAIGVPVATSGALPRSLGWTRTALAAAGFEGKAGQTLVVPTASGPTVVVVGI